MATTKYIPSYTENDETTEQWHDRILELNGKPATLSQIRNVCKCSGCKATLYDKPGFLKGWVNANGDYRLC